MDSIDGRGACVTISCCSPGCWSQTFCRSCRISSADNVSSSRGRASGLPIVVAVRVRLMLRWVLDEGRGRPGIEGEAVGEVDMRSFSGSSEAFRFREDMFGCCCWGAVGRSEECVSLVCVVTVELRFGEEHRLGAAYSYRGDAARWEVEAC